jgi:bifunctional non-homologous end joining protein LigD
LLDGEIVCLDDDGKPDFASLWFRNRGAASPAVCFMVFDLLEHDGRTLIDIPYSERRKRLDALDLNDAFWCTPPTYVGEGASLFEATKSRGLEGVIAKRIDSRYRPGIRSRAWIKTKHMQVKTFALLGWVPPEEWRGDRGCVVLGLSHGGDISMAGVVESGYGRDLVDRLPELTRADVRELRSGTPWKGSDEPLTAAVKYLERSEAGGLRHATFVGVVQ